jgi:geranylgeranyl diphosphate synthase, type I
MAVQVTQRAAAAVTRSADASAILERAAEITGQAYRAAADELPYEIRHVVGYHAGWWDSDGRPLGRGGKAMRPAFALSCAQAAGGRNPAEAVAAAVAVELVHDFSLLHDDVIDGDLTRRHRPTAWTVFGTSQAILAGDILIALAMQQAARVPGHGVRVLSGALEELCAGQWADVGFKKSDLVPVGECVQMADGKTGALLGAACQLGALAGGAATATADRYREFGRQLGIAFQLVDDELGIWGDPRLTGKPVGADLVARKKSLPVVAALNSGTAAGEYLAWIYAQDEPLDAQAVTLAADLVESAGGRAWARAEATRRVALAHAALAAASPDDEAAEDLRALAGLVTSRER